MTGGYYYADLIIFGYANGTDTVTSISSYLIDSDDFLSSLNIITELYNKITIDNNIFGYVQTDNIVIVSIPEGIKFYKGSGDNKELITNGTTIDKSIEYSYGEVLDLKIPFDVLEIENEEFRSLVKNISNEYLSEYGEFCMIIGLNDDK